VNAVWRTPTLRFDHFLHETHPRTLCSRVSEINICAVYHYYALNLSIFEVASA
jgi:hypothetical protein